jgi:hypothetical protein
MVSRARSCRAVGGSVPAAVSASSNRSLCQQDSVKARLIENAQGLRSQSTWHPSRSAAHCRAANPTALRYGEYKSGNLTTAASHCPRREPPEGVPLRRAEGDTAVLTLPTSGSILPPAPQGGLLWGPGLSTCREPLWRQAVPRRSPGRSRKCQRPVRGEPSIAHRSLHPDSSVSPTALLEGGVVRPVEGRSRTRTQPDSAVRPCRAESARAGPLRPALSVGPERWVSGG